MFNVAPTKTKLIREFAVLLTPIHCTYWYKKY